MNEKLNFAAENLTAAQHPDYKAEIAQILRGTLTPQPMKERIHAYHENDIAAAMELLSREERGRLYGILDTGELASVLEYSGHLDEYVKELTLRRQVDVLSQLESMGFQPEITQYNFCTNGSHYAGEAGIRTLGIGPSRENLAHTIDEYIELEQLEKVSQCYYGVMRALLK